jgi:CYTH domain-containing protein
MLRLTHERKRVLFAELEREWLSQGGKLAALVAAVETLATALAAEAHPERRTLPQEIERKYLLRGLPAYVHKHPSIDIDQGWIPGERLHERVRRTRQGGSEHYDRCVKIGEGIRRIEIEEPTTRAVFARLWPLTRGKRVRKRRWIIEEDGMRWEIDAFRGRDLVLAEVELPSENVEVRIPPWLTAYVVREVTDDPAYLNLNLAR